MKCIDNCFDEASVYITTFVMYSFFLNMLVFFLMTIKFISKKLLDVVTPIANIFANEGKPTSKNLGDLVSKKKEEGQKLLKETEIKQKTKDLLEKEDLVYQQINLEVERQIKLVKYNNEEDFDQMIIDYMQLMVNYSIVTIVGVCFSMSFLVTYVGLTAKLTYQKKMMVTQKRRPDPVSCANIGEEIVDTSNQNRSLQDDP